MPPKKKAAEAAGSETEKKETKPQKVLVQPRKPGEWMQMLKTAEADHFRRLHVTIRLRDKLMAGKPANLDAANAMLKARGLEDQIKAVPIDDPNARAAAAEQVQDEGLCEFHVREGLPGIWMPTNNIKAGIKENWSVLGFRNEVRGSRGRLAEGVFVYSIVAADKDPADKDWLYLGEKPDGVHTAVSHTTGPSGPVSAIKRHEFVTKRELRFEIAIARKNVMEGLPDEAMARTLYHFGEHGLGACRSQGFGRFDVIAIDELPWGEEVPQQEGVASQAS